MTAATIPGFGTLIQSPISQVELLAMGGAIARVDSSATAASVE